MNAVSHACQSFQDVFAYVLSCTRVTVKGSGWMVVLLTVGDMADLSS